MRTDDLRSSVLFCCLNLSGYFIWGDLSVKAESGKVTNVGEVNIDILFGILDVLTTSLVDNDLADECSQDFGRTENDLEKNYGELPKDGPYSLVNGGGGHGIIWGRSTENVVGDKLPRGIQGIYNGCPASDGRGSVIAMNFRQTLNAQHFEGQMTDPVVCTAADCFEYLSQDWQKVLNDLGYAKDGKANFAVWTNTEYDELQKMLCECISIISELNRKTAELAANITADLAPSHIRKNAEYVGAFVYRFYSIDKLVSKLFDMDWIKTVGDNEKPAVCVVRN